MKVINFIANCIWVLLGGLFSALSWCLCGLVLCMTIIGIPLGVQCFKFAKVSFAPFGKKIEIHFDEHPIANVLWLLFFGWEMCLANFISSLLCCVTIIGIPAGIQGFKLCKLSVAPFGATITK